MFIFKLQGVLCDAKKSPHDVKVSMNTMFKLFSMNSLEYNLSGCYRLKIYSYKYFSRKWEVRIFVINKRCTKIVGSQSSTWQDWILANILAA